MKSLFFSFRAHMGFGRTYGTCGSGGDKPRHQFLLSRISICTHSHIFISNRNRSKCCSWSSHIHMPISESERAIESVCVYSLFCRSMACRPVRWQIEASSGRAICCAPDTGLYLINTMRLLFNYRIAACLFIQHIFLNAILLLLTLFFVVVFGIGDIYFVCR